MSYVQSPFLPAGRGRFPHPADGPPEPTLEELLLGRSPAPPVSPAVRGHLRGQVVLVTGAAGSIGSHLAACVLRCQPKTLLLLDQAESALADLLLTLRQTALASAPDTQLVPLLADIRNAARLEAIFRDFRPQVVFHTAAYKHVPLLESHPREAVEVNVLGTVALADLSRHHGAQAFVLISTDKAVNPVSIMGATKRLAEQYLQQLHQQAAGSTCRFLTTRFGNVLGSSGSVLRIFQEQLRAGGPLTVTHRGISRYFMTVSEASQLILEANWLGQGGELFLFDMGTPVRVADLARRLIQLTDPPPNQPVRIRFTGLRPGEKLEEDLLGDQESRQSTLHPQIYRVQTAPVDAERVRRQIARLRWLAGQPPARPTDWRAELSL